MSICDTIDFEDMKVEEEIVINQRDRDDRANHRSTNQTADIAQMTRIAS
jgi:hypothetical protein